MKNENVCSQYNNEILTLLNESEDLMDALYRIALAVFIMGALCLCSMAGKYGGQTKSIRKSSVEIV